MEQADFCGDFKVHTRWIETEFNVDIPPAPRQIPQDSNALTRTFIEIDGKRCELGLPAELLSGLSVNNAPVTKVTSKKESNPDAVNAPISGVLFNWLIPQGEKVNEGDIIGVMEAMKMEVQVLAHQTGTLEHSVNKGDFIEADCQIAQIN